MTRKPPPLRIRNGLSWRDGKPRWEPSPASRAAGLKGLDLKDLDGAWLADRGLAISICDGRHAWAKAIREAAQQHPRADAARARLRAALEALPAPQGPDPRLRRQLVQDLLDAARQLIAGQDQAAGVSLTRAPRTVARLVEAYFDAVDAGRIKVKPATRRAYAAQRARILAAFGERAVAGLRRVEVKAWYHDELLDQVSPATANLAIGALAAFYNHALDLEWVGRGESPVFKLEQVKHHGRRVFWTMAEEMAFLPWCDAHGFADVADAVACGLYTGARPIDICAADLEDLAGATWRFTPIKTQKHGQEAMPAVLPQLAQRVARRALEARQAPLRHLPAARTPFLWHPEAQRRHDSDSIGRRFRRAKALCLAQLEPDDPAQNSLGETLAAKRLQDTRDTCITRLWLADVAPARMWSWTGHGQASVEEILREHYLVLQEQGQVELGAKLAAWAKAEALKLA